MRTALYDDDHRVMAERSGSASRRSRAPPRAPSPLRRANEPEDIAAMVVFLASPGARNITGQSFNVDGGLIPD